METIADLLADAREREGPAFDAPGRTTPYSAGELATTVRKAGNLLSHYGVREGVRVAVVVGPADPGPGDEPGHLVGTPQPLLGALGAMRLGATVSLDPDRSVDATALVVPASWRDRYEVDPGCAVLAYGDAPADPAVAHFEREVWSENPVAPPETVAPDAVALDGPSGGTQGSLLSRAATLAETHGMAGRRVAVRGRMDGAVFVAGVLAPLVAGGTIVGGPDGEGDRVVGAGGDVTARAFSDQPDTRRT